MPTTKPRVQVTLNPSTHEVIERMASLQGKTRGFVISDLLDSVAPALSRTVALLEAAAAAPESVKKGLLEVVEGAHGDFANAAGDSINQMDLLMEKMAEISSGQEGVNPHIVTRGSGTGVEVKGKSRKVNKTKGLAKKTKGGR